MTLMVSRNIAINNSSLFFHTLDLCSIRSTLNFRSTHYIRIYHIRIYHLRISIRISLLPFCSLCNTWHSTPLAYVIPLLPLCLFHLSAAPLLLLHYSAIQLFHYTLLVFSAILLLCFALIVALSFNCLLSIHSVPCIQSNLLCGLTVLLF